MDERDLLGVLARGEDSHHQFKRDCTNVGSLAAELAAMSNSGGGQIFVRITDGGEVAGLTIEDVRRLNQLIGNACSQHVRRRATRRPQTSRPARGWSSW